MGLYPPDFDDCNVGLWYPDWGGKNEGCNSDGKEPYYMIVHKDYYLYHTREECCRQFYEWDYYTCSETLPVLSYGTFYPDWSDYSDLTCRNDDKMPAYMLNNQNWYFSYSLEECCERHFYWDRRKCLGSSAVGSQKWYVKYSAETCVQDCVGPSPCGGLAEEWDELHNNKGECCDKKLWWNSRCRRNSG